MMFCDRLFHNSNIVEKKHNFIYPSSYCNGKYFKEGRTYETNNTSNTTKTY